VVDSHQLLQLSFDATGKLLLIPTLGGIKVIDWARNKVLRVIGNLCNNQNFYFLLLILAHNFSFNTFAKRPSVSIVLKCEYAGVESTKIFGGGMMVV
jgi:hypothetical protein